VGTSSVDSESIVLWIYQAMGSIGVDFEIHVSLFSELSAAAAPSSTITELNCLDASGISKSIVGQILRMGASGVDFKLFVFHFPGYGHQRFRIRSPPF
jgi:hypothetical protein